ncbi:MAG: hypothetical protein V1682_05090 [Candidatus Omnitrophota bacterium]
MKNITWPVAVIILAAMCVIGFRYDIVVNSPIVAKIDRITGDVWVANSGMWLKVQHAAPVKAVAPIAAQAEKAEEKK